MPSGSSAHAKVPYSSSWTSGDTVVELEPDGILIVPPNTPHGFRNIGDEPLLVVSVHERATLRQSWLGEDPA